MLKGGIPRGDPILVTGEAGTGKTTLGLQFIYNGAVQFGETGIFLSYEEPRVQIVHIAASFGWDFNKLIAERKVVVDYVPLTQIDPAEQIMALERSLQETGATRVVIDSLTLLMSRLGDPEMVRRHLYQLVAVLKNAGCTGLITIDPLPGSGSLSRFGVEESIVDGIFVLKFVATKRGRVRLFEIFQLRGVNHGTGDNNAMQITSHGIEIDGLNIRA